MKHLQEALSAILNDPSLEVNVNTAKLEQKTRNRYKTLITESLLADLQEMIDNMPLPEGCEPILLARVDKGIGLALWTQYGYIPMFMEASMKGLDFDISGAAEEYQEKLQEAAKKKETSAKNKADKIARDAALREKKRQEREKRGLTTNYEEYKG